MKGCLTFGGFFLAIGIIVIIVKYILPATVFIIIPIGASVLLYSIFSHIYFNSDKFINLKKSIHSYIQNCNDLNSHINELKNSFIDISSYDYGQGELIDESNYNFKRKEWQNNIKTHQVYNCSLAICKSASNQPIKYLCKYFKIESDEITLSNFESVLNDFAAANQGKELLRDERDTILSSISDSIPKLIMYVSKKEVIRKLGFEAYDFSDLYFPKYTFQYISAGGNSSTKCDIRLDVENLEKLVLYLNDLIKFRNSVQGQRALMTSSLREKIKSRDNFCCKKCSLSVREEKNLLLEIDHIIPLSKGGITSEDNLQTLCWRCNRSKGSKIENT